MYYSAYGSERIATLATRLRELTRKSPGRSVYCIFDNTAGGAAPVNALELRRALGGGAWTMPGITWWRSEFGR
jgi:uncharacterized protein YecE (DUF72 family)